MAIWLLDAEASKVQCIAVLWTSPLHRKRSGPQNVSERKEEGTGRNGKGEFRDRAEAGDDHPGVFVGVFVWKGPSVILLYSE